MIAKRFFYEDIVPRGLKIKRKKYFSNLIGHPDCATNENKLDRKIEASRKNERLHQKIHLPSSMKKILCSSKGDSYVFLLDYFRMGYELKNTPYMKVGFKEKWRKYETS